MAHQRCRCVMLFLFLPLTPLLQFHPRLSGESVPVMKTPLPVTDVTYSPESQRRHTLFCGTHIIQAKGGCPSGKGAIAVVTQTGNCEHRILLQCHVFRNSFGRPGFCFNPDLLLLFFSYSGFFTAKGDLISSILYPQPVNFRFYTDAMKFLLFLGVVGKLINIKLF